MLDITFHNFLLCLIITALAMKMLTQLLIRKKVDNLQGKYVLVTGCASGFGFAIARRLEDCGFKVLATCRRQESVNRLRLKLKDGTLVKRLDVTDSKQIQEVYMAVRKTISPTEELWGIVNNAGIMFVGPVDWQPLDRFKQVVDVNLWGTIEVTKTFLPLVKESRGRVVNIGSLLGKISMPYMAAYSISKYGIEAFSDALRREMRPWNVQVSVVAPGAHKTKLVDGTKLGHQLEDLWCGLNEETKQEYGERSLQKVQTKLIPLALDRQRVQDFKLMDRISSTGLSEVADAVLDALTAVTPKPRYEIGLDAWVFAVITWLPTAISDWILSFMAPLPRRNERLAKTGVIEKVTDKEI